MEKVDLLEEKILSYREIRHSMKFLSFFFYYAEPLYGFQGILLMKEYLPILLCTQGLVYRADFEIEKAQKEQFLDRGHNPWLEEKGKLLEILKKLDLYSEQIEIQANHLLEYWDLESRLMAGEQVTLEKLQKAIQLRASDIIILHLICEKMSGIDLGKEVWRCIQSIEVIRDIEADLRQYQADFHHGDFNICRMFSRYYGAQAGVRLAEELNTRKTIFQTQVLSLSSPSLEAFQELVKRYEKERPPLGVPEIFEETLITHP